jgi:hypothetical protein
VKFKGKGKFKCEGKFKGKVKFKAKEKGRKRGRHLRVTRMPAQARISASPEVTRR